jgi:Iap family predicted aminopeptidase
MRLILFFIFIIVHASHLFAQDFSWTIEDSKRLLQTLAHDSLQGRKAGSSYEKKSLDFISKELRSHGKIKLKRQSFYAPISENDSVQCSNGYFFINNKKDQTILISAHYDHIGMGGALSKAPGKIEVHNGADDNASGVTLVFELLNFLPKHYNYLIVFYSAHEIGLYGSQAFQEISNKKKYRKIKAHINFDMVGRLDKTNPTLRLTHNFPDNKIFAYLPIKINYNPVEKLEQFDTRTNVRLGIPCVNISTGLHSDYHQPSDDAQYINYEGLKMLADYVIKFIVTI